MISLSVSSTAIYPVLFTTDPFQEITRCAKSRTIVIITQREITERYQESLEELEKKHAATILEFPSGEEHKTLSSVEMLTNALQEKRYDRKNTLIVALGGGIVGDVAGFVASMYLRGVPYLQVPTTLLAMVDSSIGGKTGVNTKFGKNLLGAFYHPEAVIISPFFLKTLPEKEISNGLAEMVKHAILDGTEHLEYLENAIPQIFTRDEKICTEAIEKSIMVKKRHVEADEKEQSAIRSFLNFGHTIGHAIEKASHYEIAHGQAIAIGMVMESQIAAEKLGFSQCSDVVRILEKCHLPTTLPSSISVDELWKWMEQDKKNEGGKVFCAVPQTIGNIQRISVGFEDIQN